MSGGGDGNGDRDGGGDGDAAGAATDGDGRWRIVSLDGGAGRAVRDERLGEVMHPGVGPRAEAEALYVAQSRLRERLADGKVTLFDVGLGAGSNALAARRAAAAAAAAAAAGTATVSAGGARLEIVSFERDLAPLRLALAREPAAFDLDGEAGIAARALLDHGRHDGVHARWRLEPGDLLAALARTAARADVVFWDPFSPRANPEAWTVRAFSLLRARAAPRCTVFTYSASTTTRAALLLAGFAVGVGDAIGRKAETTAAAVDRRDLARPLDGRFAERLARSSAPLPSDAPPDARERLRAALAPAAPDAPDAPDDDATAPLTRATPATR